MNAPAKHEPAKPIPADRQGATPRLCVRNGEDAIAFYKKAFGAKELLKIEHGGKVGHAELAIGAAHIMLSDEFPEYDVFSPQTIGGTPVTIHLYVESVDAFTETAVEAGLKVLCPVQDQFYGDRGGRFEDPFGHRWSIASRLEDLSHDELKRRAAALFATKDA
jgi:PhnB protein